jgi:hypothetical protein
MDVSDEMLREQLQAVDDGEEEVTAWEAAFINNLVYEYGGPLSDKQRETAQNIIDRYL